MTSHRFILKLGVLTAGIVSACSLTVPSEDELFGGASAGGSSGSSGAPAGGNMSNGGDPSDIAGSGGKPTGGGGGKSPTGGSSNGGAGGSGADGGAPPQGGAGGEPPEPMPTGEIVNASFELSLTGWTVAPKTASIFAQYQKPGVVEAVDGNYVLSGWHMTEPYKAKVSQVIEGLEDGTYRLSASIAAIPGIPSASLYATNCGGTDPEPVGSASDSWHEIVIEAVEVVGGSCEIGFDIDAKASDWVNIDVVAFEKIEPE